MGVIKGPRPDGAGRRRLGGQEHVLEVGRGVVAVGPARRIAVRRGVRRHRIARQKGDWGIAARDGERGRVAERSRRAARARVAEARAAERHAVDGECVVDVGHGAVLKGHHLICQRAGGRRIDADDQAALAERRRAAGHRQHPAGQRRVRGRSRKETRTLLPTVKVHIWSAADRRQGVW